MNVRLVMALVLTVVFTLYAQKTEAAEYGWFGCIGMLLLIAYLIATGFKQMDWDK